MVLHGRTIPWNSFIAEVDARRGTLVVERFSFKGPVRWWWTSENVYDLCPYPLTDWLTMSRDSTFQRGAEWCHQRFTNVDEGKALLVVATPEQKVSLRNGETFTDAVRWVEVTPSKRVQVVTVDKSPLHSLTGGNRGGG